MTEPITTSQDITPSNRIIQLGIWAILLISILNFFFNGFLPAFDVRGVDFTGYYDFAVNPDPRVADTDQPWFLYFPIWSLFFKPLTLFSLPIAKNIWIFCNLIFTCLFIRGAVAWLKGHNPFKLPGLSLYSIVCFLVLNFPPLWVTFRNGQINLLVLFLLAASYYAYWKRYPVITGILLALAITTRYTPGIFLLFWLLKKEYRIVRITLLTLFGLVFTSFLVFGWQVHKDYFILGQHYAAYVKLHYNYFANITLYSLLSNIKAAGYLPIGFPALGVQLGFAILITGLTAIITFKSPADRYYALEYGLFGAMLPLLSYFGENHHFTFTLLGFITALGYSLRKEIGLLLALCWLLIYSGYYCEEVLLLPQLSFWKNYIDWLGVFCGYLMLLFILNDFKKKTLSYDRSNSN